MNGTAGSRAGELPLRRIFHTWWPLAASWLLMGVELPALTAVVARLPDSKINLAAYGGVVFPIALIIEAPIIMLLAASTALSQDWASYVKIRRFMLAIGASLTVLHFLVAFTPLYDVVARDIINAPAEIIEPARIGLMIMLPWSWSIGFRRFNQGVLIRFGHSRAVGIGTATRLLADGVVLGIGYLLGSVPGIVVATGAVAAGVLSEALYTGLRVRPVLRDQLRPAPPVEPLTWPAFINFYTPLALTSLLTLLMQPVGSAAISRMPGALDSLAVWPVVTGLVFMLRSAGMAYNEVVVAMLDRPRSSDSLRRFTALLASGVTGTHLLLAATPLTLLWFGGVSALPPDLTALARLGFWLALPIPALNVLQSWYQGAILHYRRTRGIPESIALSLIIVGGVLVAGVAWGRMTGLYVGVAALTVSVAIQTSWLWVRSRPAMQTVRVRDGRLSET